MSEVTRQYRTRDKATGKWSQWYNYTGDGGFRISLTCTDAIEVKEVPRPCKAVAPFEIENVSLVTCDSSDVAKCVTRGTHVYELAITSDNYWEDCDHFRQISWSVAL